MENLSIAFEIMMIILFGVSWPFNLIRAYKAKTTKGTSLIFLLLIFIGYAAGIISKVLMSVVEGRVFWTPLRIIALIAYSINFLMLLTGLLIYFRNKKEEKKLSSIK